MAELRVPRYQQVIETLIAEIRAGNYEIGEKIATEAEQVERFKVSRITIRKAMEHLEQEGYISREIGRGTFVRSFGSTAAKDKPVGMVAFLLIGVTAENDYNYQEIITTERFLSERGIPFSWAALTEEDLIRGRYPTVIEKRMCAGLILDGHVNDAHMALAEQFGVKMVAVGNHAISAHLPQVRSRLRKAFKSVLGSLLGHGRRRVLIAIEPMVMHLSHEMLEVYSWAVTENGQDEQLVYLCPDDQPPSSLRNIIEKSGDDLIVLTTEIIFRKLIATPDPRPIGNRPNFIVLSSLPTDRAMPMTYLITPRARAMQLLAAERLLDLIEGRATSVYEELDCDIIQPA